MRKWIVTGLGTGYLPVAPGTWGSGAVAAIFVAVALISGAQWGWVSAAMLALAAGASIACVKLGAYAEAAFGRKDPSQCTIDEWAGQAVTYFLLPLSPDPQRILIVAAAGFLAFRAADILKPPPARGLEKLPGGGGILIDDLIAGAYANILCQVILRLAPA